MSLSGKGLRVPHMTRLLQLRLSRPGALALLAALASYPVALPPVVLAASSVGLSSVRARGIDNFELGGNLPGFQEEFGHAFAVGDWNGDGVDDLATGLPYDDGVANIQQYIGAVYVQFGIAGAGLAPPGGAVLLSQEVGPDLAFDDEQFGWALAAGDFDGDGFDDLAVGVPGNEVVGVATGGVQIYFGSGSSPVLDIGTILPIPGAAGDRIGLALAAGDFNNDGYDDLATGMPLQSTAAGAVRIDYGGPGGFFTGGLLLRQDSPSIDDVGEENDRFGFALTSGDFDGNGHADLAVGVPNENGYGALHVFFWNGGGLDLTRDLFWTQNSIAGTSESNDKFGFALAAGDFDGDGRDDLAIGSPGETLGLANELTDSGAVAVTYGSSTGIFFDLARTQGWAQGGLIGLDTAELGDRFGEAFAVGDFDGDGRDDLMIGHPEEDTTSSNTGAATVLLGGATGFAQARSRLLLAASEGIPGAGFLHAYFGSAATAGDFDADGYADLVIGELYGSSPTGSFRAGMEIVLYGSMFSDGFESQDTSYWSAVAP